MKIRALSIVTIILASNSVQAQDGSESTVNPKTSMNSATKMAPLGTVVPMMAAATNPTLPTLAAPTNTMVRTAPMMAAPASPMAPMMGAPSNMMVPLVVVPANMVAPIMAALMNLTAPVIAALMGMANPATMLNPMNRMPMLLQTPAQGYGVPAYGIPATPAQGAFASSFFPVPGPASAPVAGPGPAAASPAGPTVAHPPRHRHHRPVKKMSAKPSAKPVVSK